MTSIGVDTEVTQVHVRFVDGTDVLVPVPAHRLGDSEYLLLPSHHYEFDDLRLLWEYGPGDVVRAEVRKSLDGDDYRIASALIQEGDKRNSLRRLIWWVLKEEPPAEDVLQSYAVQVVLALLRTELAGHYTTVHRWLETHGEWIETQLGSHFE